MLRRWERRNSRQWRNYVALAAFSEVGQIPAHVDATRDEHERANAFAYRAIDHSMGCLALAPPPPCLGRSLKTLMQVLPSC